MSQADKDTIDSLTTDWTRDHDALAAERDRYRIAAEQYHAVNQELRAELERVAAERDRYRAALSDIAKLDMGAVGDIAQEALNGSENTDGA